MSEFGCLTACRATRTRTYVPNDDYSHALKISLSCNGTPGISHRGTADVAQGSTIVSEVVCVLSLPIPFKLCLRGGFCDPRRICDTSRTTSTYNPQLCLPPRVSLRTKLSSTTYLNRYRKRILQVARKHSKIATTGQSGLLVFCVERGNCDATAPGQAARRVNDCPTTVPTTKLGREVGLSVAMSSYSNNGWVGCCMQVLWGSVLMPSL